MSDKPASLGKITRPSLSRVSPRRRLFALLDRGRRASIVWVTGPPGSGKTTLVSSYLDARHLRYIWYQLDGGDADLATFFYYMGIAATGDAHGTHLPLLTPEYDIDTFTRHYFRTLYGRLKTPFTLVLDNYSDVPAQSELHDLMAQIVAETPPKSAVIFLSRHEPPTSMARLLASGRMELIGWEDLRLTLQEAGDILKQRDIKLAREPLTRLYERTQGWAAGLILMITHWRGGGVASELPQTATPQLIFDYLLDEVFRKLHPKIQEFALQIAYLPQMTAPMAAELTGQAQAATILADGHRHNYFVNLKQAHPELVYEYHPLARDFLRARAESTFNEDERRSLKRRSAALLARSGQTELAIELLAEIDDWQEMLQLILAHAPTMLDQGRGQTLAQWFDQVPAEELERQPWALYWLGASRLPFAPRESRHLSERAFEGFKTEPQQDPRGLLLACSGVLDAILHEMDDLSLLDRWIGELDTLVREYPHFPSEGVEARVTFSMSLALIMREPHHPEIEEWLRRALAISQSLSDPSRRMWVALLVALSYSWTGQFAKALDLIAAVRELGKLPAVSPLALTTLKNIESMYYMLTADRERCLAAVEEGLRIAEETGVRIWSYQLRVNGVAGALGAGDVDTAQKLLAEAHAHPEGARRVDLCLYHYFAAWGAMLRSDTLRAFQEQKHAFKLSLDLGSPYFEVLCRLALAQIQVHYGREREVVAHLREVHRIARKIRNHLLEFMCLLGYAQLALAHGRRRSGLNSLRYALALGREHAYMHFLWWRPEVVAELCAYALDAGIEVEYVKELVRRRSLIPLKAPVNVKHWPWRFKIFALGQFRLLRDDEPVRFSGKAQRRPLDLLRALIAYGGKEVSEDYLTEALWPRIDGDSAHRSFTTTLHRLRKLLGEDQALVLKEGKLSLDRSYSWVDIWALDELLVEIEKLRIRRRQDVTVDEVDSIADKLLLLYQGPFMGNEADRSWYLPARERLRAKFLRGMTGIAHYWEEQQQWARAVDYYGQALEADGLAEGLYRNLMLCYQKLGRQAEGIETYKRCRNTLLAALGVEPSPETTRVYESLLES